MAVNSRVAVITVFHNSAIYFDRYVEALRLQTRPPDLVILIDSGSKDSTYLHRVAASGLHHCLKFHENVGFCKGNNLGYALSGDAEYLFFLNPDAFPEPTYLERSLELLQTEAENAAAFSGALLGFDIRTGDLTGQIDSTGIVSTWYGRLVDRDQGKPNEVLAGYPPISEVPALCGAAMLCTRTALNSISPDGRVFDESFFSYKEDIDLSWRLRAAGWRLLFAPAPQIHHCRGWKQRKDVPAKLKLLSSRNEVSLYKKHGSLYQWTALLKYLLVRILGV